MDRRRVLAIAIALWPSLVLAQATGRNDGLALPLNGQHPAAYYKSAGGLMTSGQPDAAVFIFYLGQLRYRTHLAARPDLPKSGDPALFGSLSEVVGRPVNEYAFGDIPALLRTLDEVLAHDARHPDRFTPPGEFPEAARRVRSGMASFRNQMAAQADDIRKARAANGLPNR
jgi:hypothetical protein